VQHVLQPAARRIRIGVGPQQASHVIATHRCARIRQIRDEAEALTQSEVDAAPVEAPGGKSEKLNLQASHHEPLIPPVPAGDGPGTLAS
jgi:hypothetical protein